MDSVFLARMLACPWRRQGEDRQSPLSPSTEAVSFLGETSLLGRPSVVAGIPVGGGLGKGFVQMSFQGCSYS